MLSDLRFGVSENGQRGSKNDGGQQHLQQRESLPFVATARQIADPVLTRCSVTIWRTEVALALFRNRGWSLTLLGCSSTNQLKAYDTDIFPAEVSSFCSESASHVAKMQPKSVNDESTLTEDSEGFPAAAGVPNGVSRHAFPRFCGHCCESASIERIL